MLESSESILCDKWSVIFLHHIIAVNVSVTAVTGLRLCCFLSPPTKMDADEFTEKNGLKVEKAAESLAVSLLAFSGHVAYQAVQPAVVPSVLFPLSDHQQQHFPISQVLSVEKGAKLTARWERQGSFLHIKD